MILPNEILLQIATYCYDPDIHLFKILCDWPLYKYIVHKVLIKCYARRGEYYINHAGSTASGVFSITVGKTNNIESCMGALAMLRQIEYVYSYWRVIPMVDFKFVLRCETYLGYDYIQPLFGRELYFDNDPIHWGTLHNDSPYVIGIQKLRYNDGNIHTYFKPNDVTLIEKILRENRCTQIM